MYSIYVEVSQVGQYMVIRWLQCIEMCRRSTIDWSHCLSWIICDIQVGCVLVAFLTDKRHSSCRRDSLFHEYFIDIASAGAIDFHLLQRRGVKSSRWLWYLGRAGTSWVGAWILFELKCYQSIKKTCIQHWTEHNVREIMLRESVLERRTLCLDDTNLGQDYLVETRRSLRALF